MTGKLSMMNAIKRAVSPNVQRSIPNTNISLANVQETPLTTYICSRLTEGNLRLFALMFAEAIKNDRHAKVIHFENVYVFLGYDYYHHAVRQLKKLFPEIQSTRPDNLTTGGEVAKSTPGPSKDSYLISVRQFETMMLAAKTDEGAKAREMMLDVKDAVQDYMKMEMEASAAQAHSQLHQEKSKLALAERDKAALSTQLKNLRDAKSYLYAFHLFDDRYKCGITDNPEKREKQHRTSCPSGRMVHTVVIACKQSEKLLDSIMKRHGNHVRQEEYEITGGEQRIAMILNTIARVEEALHALPFEDYSRLLNCVDNILETPSDDVAEEEAEISEQGLVDPAESSSSDDELESVSGEEFDPDNPLLAWLRENCTLTNSRKNKAKFPDVLEYYMQVHVLRTQTFNVGRNQFYKSLRSCGLTVSKGNGYFVCHGIILRAPLCSDESA